MKLFSSAIGNVLPFDGEVRYFGPVLTEAGAAAYFDTLMHNVAWKHDELTLFGRRVVTPRMVAWYGDNNLTYTYSKTTKTALAWTPALLELKELAEELSGARFNSCLLNLYHDGSEGMGWHADAEKELGANPVIASLSFGAARRFLFKHKTTAEKRELLLESGSLLVMCGATQAHWVHSLPKAARVMQPRINLTFRFILNP